MNVLLNKTAWKTQTTMYPFKEDKGVIPWFFNFTSIGGLSQINATDWTISKIIWAILFCIGAALTAVSLHMVIKDYTYVQHIVMGEGHISIQ